MYIGDLHIHSRYSRATSKEGDPEHLDLWARKKGIHIVGTGDFTHPAWRQEMQEKLEPAEEGLYVLKPEYRMEDGETPDAFRPRFVVTGEISSIYKKQGRVRKVHSLLLLPGLEEAEALSRRLELIGNIHSDGRPILGLDCRDLLEILLETCPQGMFVPAHIWTPHFSLFGAFSGFDRIQDCFEDLTPHIHALETGLSSDPPMNWRVSALDSFHLLSNSDAHSPAKLGREANLFDIELSYPGLRRAIEQGEGLAGTLEFFPEEGKYHLDGHRKCGLCLEPEEAERLGNVCPVCGRKLTVGVLHRVVELSDRPAGFHLAGAKPFENLVPLPELIAAATGASAAGKKTLALYGRMLQCLGDEFSILRQVPPEDIQAVAGPLVAEGVRRLRRGEVRRTGGFDGEYGKIQLFTPEEASEIQGQMSLFTPDQWQQWEQRGTKPPRRTGDPDDREEGRQDQPSAGSGVPETKAEETAQKAAAEAAAAETADGLNPEQREAVQAPERAVAVIAGPGAGKTKTLIARLAWLLQERQVDPGQITAVTFTRQAAEEMRSRLKQLPGGKAWSRKLWIGTFHSLCSRLLAEAGKSFSLADPSLQRELAEQTRGAFGLKVSASAFLRELSRRKNGGRMEEAPAGILIGAPANVPEEATAVVPEETPAVAPWRIPPEAFAFYQEKLREAGALDFDDLLREGLALLEGPEEAGAAEPSDAGEAAALATGPAEGLRAHFRYLLVDEFQDINPVQYRLLQAWNRQGQELFVIGDPDQSIYGFRGSDARCFERLQEDFPQLRRITLRYNYRSTPEILGGALSLIGHNAGEPRQLEAARSGGRPIRLAEAPGERAEAAFVAREINRLVGGIDMLGTQEEAARQDREVRSFSDLAVLYRTHRQGQALEERFRQEGIPYVTAGREDFLQDPEVRGTLYFFQHVLHPEDPLAERLARRLLWPASGKQAAEQMALLAEKYRNMARRGKPVKLLEEWAEDLSLENPEALGRLADMAVLHTSLEDFLETLTFGEEGDVRRNGGRKFTADAVTLMTFHGSKGLEFPVVFLYGLRKGMVPLETSGETDVEEERRLLFVSMTRAREELILTCSGEPSPFLGELEPERLAREKTGKEPEEVRQLSLFDFL